MEGIILASLIGAVGVAIHNVKKLWKPSEAWHYWLLATPLSFGASAVSFVVYDQPWSWVTFFALGVLTALGQRYAENDWYDTVKEILFGLKK